VRRDIYLEDFFDALGRSFLVSSVELWMSKRMQPQSRPKAAIACEMLEQSSLALVGKVRARLTAAPAKEASKLAIDMTLSRLPDGLENAVQNAGARRPGGTLWQVCGTLADGEVSVPGNGVHGRNPSDSCERFSLICCPPT
jgi:hypothetical protein